MCRRYLAYCQQELRIEVDRARRVRRRLQDKLRDLNKREEARKVRRVESPRILRRLEDQRQQDEAYPKTVPKGYRQV